MCFIQIHQLRLKLPLFWIKGKKQVIDPRLICSRTFSLVDVIVVWLKLWWGCDIWASFWFLWKKKLQSYPWGPKLFAYQHKCSILTAPTRWSPCICSNIGTRKLWSVVSSWIKPYNKQNYQITHCRGVVESENAVSNAHRDGSRMMLRVSNCSNRC